jgi:hypothetical protein
MRMSGPSAFRGTLVLLAVGAAAAPALADGGIPLAKVARDLGFRYAYLALENGVSLTRAGAVIVVRPGDGFFTINNRREPVYGTIPFYRDNDVVVSHAFEAEIRGLGTPPARVAKRAPAPAIARRAAPAPADDGQVRSVGGTFVAAASSVEIVGRATPGTLVTLVLRGDLSEGLPVITIGGTSVVADASGTFEARMSNAPDRFTYTRLFVEAAAPGNVSPITAYVENVGADKSARTRADDALKY